MRKKITTTFHCNQCNSIDLIITETFETEALSKNMTDIQNILKAGQNLESVTHQAGSNGKAHYIVKCNSCQHQIEFDSD